MAWRAGLLQITRRVTEWRPAFVLGAYALALAEYGLVLTGPAVTRLLPLAAAPVVFTLGVCVLAVLAGAMIAVRRDTSLRYLLGAYTCLTLFLLLAYRVRLETALLLVLTCVLWAVLFQPFPACLVLGCSIAVLLPASLLAVDAAWVPAAAVATAGLGEAALGAFLIRSHERTVDLQRYANRLEENVASLTRANILSQDYAKDIELESRVRERDRLTRDIHDAIGYTLTNTIMMMEAIKVMVRTEPERVPGQIKRMRAHTEEGLASIKKILRDFRSRNHSEESLLWAIKKLVKVFSVSTGLEVRYELGNANVADLEAFSDAVYHFIQEGLINAFRHGRATRVSIMLWDYGDRIQVVLDDNGRGCPGGATPGIGISGMRERAALVGGSVSVDRVYPGFRISMFLPARTA